MGIFLSRPAQTCENSEVAIMELPPRVPPNMNEPASAPAPAMVTPSPRYLQPPTHQLTEHNLACLQWEFGDKALIVPAALEVGRTVLKRRTIEKWLAKVAAHQPPEFGPINAEILRRTDIRGLPSVPLIMKLHSRLRAICQVQQPDDRPGMDINGPHKMLWEIQGVYPAETLEEYYEKAERKMRAQLRAVLSARGDITRLGAQRWISAAYRILEEAAELDDLPQQC